MPTQSSTPAPVAAMPVVVVGGPTGPPSGQTGPTGPAGVASLTGATGFTGPTGITGPTGQLGPTGVGAFTGPRGVTGPPGSGAIGPTGYTGPAGAIGPTGGGNVLTAFAWNDGHYSTPTGNVSTTETAMGLGSTFYIYPVNTGTAVLVIMSGMVMNSSAAGDGVTITGRHGSGTPPANGATSGLGTQFAIPQHFVASTTAGQQGFCIHDIIYGSGVITAGVQHWFDISIAAVTGGGATLKDLHFSAVEIANG